MEIRDLAYAGSRKLQALGITPPERNGMIHSSRDYPGLIINDSCNIIIPPAVHDEVGADALALIIQSGIRDSPVTAIAIDYGANAEMALCHQGRFYTGSASAGPALEGQHISCGSLAVPGVISDLIKEGPYHRLQVLDEQMMPIAGALIDLHQASEPIHKDKMEAQAITGTGVIAALDQALVEEIISPPMIHTIDNQLHFGPHLYLSEEDLTEAGKAIGAIRAGYITLGLEAGITPGKIKVAYLAGASGTYVDARKSARLGLIPPGVERVVQVGNTSLAMARELVVKPSKLDEMEALAKTLRVTHTLFAKSRNFANLFLLELSHWTEGMPMATYRKMLSRFHLPDLPPSTSTLEIVRTAQRAIDETGEYGLVTLDSVGFVASLQLTGCHGCLNCMSSCPTSAITIDTATRPVTISLSHALCNGVACRRCEPGCEPRVFHLNTFFKATQTATDEGS
jgi:methylamine methyltransferase corrinoid protein reductive activase